MASKAMLQERRALRRSKSVKIAIFKFWKSIHYFIIADAWISKELYMTYYIQLQKVAILRTGTLPYSCCLVAVYRQCLERKGKRSQQMSIERWQRYSNIQDCTGPCDEALVSNSKHLLLISTVQEDWAHDCAVKDLALIRTKSMVAREQMG